MGMVAIKMRSVCIVCIIKQTKFDLNCIKPTNTNQNKSKQHFVFRTDNAEK